MIRFLLLFLLFCTHAQAQINQQKKPSVGAIYWGMWNSYGFGNAAITEVTLNPTQYRNRVPFFGRESSERIIEYVGPPGESRYSATTSLRINADQQWAIDQEIKYAVEAGIDYFAYIYYGKNHYAHRLYKSSSIKEKEKLKLAWIIGFMNPLDIPDMVSDMGKDFYHKVLNNRPILYFIKFDEDCSEVSDFLEKVKNEYRKQFPSSAPPYVVILNDGNPLAHYCNKTEKYYADAFSAYTSANGSSIGIHSYEYIRDKELQSWGGADISAGGQKRVLWMSFGFDRRPRIDFPVPWERTPEGNADPGNSVNWAGNATPAQIEEQIKKAVEFINNNPITCETQSLLLYAWNEHDEGGWISPTIFPGTNEINKAHMNAVKRGLNLASQCNTPINAPYLNHETPLVLQKGERTTITANCETGTPVWSTGFEGKDLILNNPESTTYHVKCKLNSCESNERFVDISVKSVCSVSPFAGTLFDLKGQNPVPPKIGENFNGKPMTMNGVNFTEIFKGGVGSVSGTGLTFDLGLNHGYGFLTGVVGLDQQSACKNSKVKFYLRDEISMDFLFTSKEISFDVSGNTRLDTFKIDIRNIRYLRMDTDAIEGENGCALTNWSLLKLECPPDCEADKPPVLSATPKEITEGESVKIDATCSVGEVYWPDGNKEKSRTFSPTRTTSYTARCRTFGCEGSLFTAPLSVKVNVNCKIPHYINYYKTISPASSIVNIGKNGLGNPLRLVDTTGEAVTYTNGFGSSGVTDIHFDLTEKREFSFFKVRVGIDPSDVCAGPVRFRIMDMVEKRDMLTSPVIYPVGKGTPNHYDMELPLAWMLWFNLQVIPENPKDSCGLYNWVNPRFECFSDIEEAVLSSSESINFDIETYPNPSQGYLQVRIYGIAGVEYNLRLTDVSGREILTKNSKISHGKIHELTLEKLKPGKYVLSVYNNGKTVSKSVVVY